MKEKIRTVRFAPYMKGKGPTFILHVFDLNSYDRMGKARLGYELRIRENGNKSIILFKGEDFACSPMHGVDSNETVKSLMGFLILRPGDTDQEYFDSYSVGQLAYCNKHAEALSLAVMNKFGE